MISGSKGNPLLKFEEAGYVIAKEEYWCQMENRFYVYSATVASKRNKVHWKVIYEDEKGIIIKISWDVIFYD